MGKAAKKGRKAAKKSRKVAKKGRKARKVAKKAKKAKKSKKVAKKAKKQTKRQRRHARRGKDHRSVRHGCYEVRQAKPNRWSDPKGSRQGWLQGWHLCAQQGSCPYGPTTCSSLRQG